VNTQSLKVSSVLAAAAILSSTCSGFCAGQSASPTPPAEGLSIEIAGPAGALFGALVYVIAKHNATVRQRRIAEERARQAYAKMPEKRKASLKAKKVHYIAVDTEKNERTSPEAKKSVMVWDTESQQMAGSNVYDVKKPPPVGSTAKFDTYSAEYVGSGT
jgi:hypothetical protein